ncbi:hypothetical protein MXB_258 [Myxobolus squamalis]|nr:hypothetical protein MXB_258 [Myxobolus squamalis]
MATEKPKDTPRYKCLYNREWEKYYPITEVVSDKNAFYCVPCKRSISCSDKGLRNVRRHCETSLHRKTITSHMIDFGVPSLSIINSTLVNPQIKTIIKGKTSNQPSVEDSSKSLPKLGKPSFKPTNEENPKDKNNLSVAELSNLEFHLNNMPFTEKYNFLVSLSRKLQFDFRFSMGPNNDNVQKRLNDGTNNIN